MQPDRLAAILFAILATGCGLAFLVMLVADKLADRRKPKLRPTVPMNQRMPPL